MSASRLHPPVTGHRIRVLWRLCGKFLLTGVCNSSTSRHFSDIADNYSARCTSRIIFSSSFSITCTNYFILYFILYYNYFKAIFLSISFRRSFKSWTFYCTYRLFAASASIIGSTTRILRIKISCDYAKNVITYVISKQSTPLIMRFASFSKR